MSLKKIFLRAVFSASIVSLLAVYNNGVQAASCQTSSGSKCEVTCSQGTASAVCSSNSKNCSTSCSDSSGNMERNLIRSLQIVTEGRISEWEAQRFIQRNLDELRWRLPTQKQIYRDGIIINID